MGIQAFVYGNHFKNERNKGTTNFQTATIKVAIMASGFSFDPDAHDVWADVSASELSAGNGYVAGGATLANPVLNQDNANDRADVDFDPVVWNASGGDIGAFAAFLYIDTTNDVIIGCSAVSPDETCTDGNSINLTPPTFRSA